MSIRVMTAVWDYGPDKAGHRMVLLALADFADDSGACFPYIATIARRAVMSERSVQRTLRALEEDGYLRRENTSGGRSAPSRYYIMLDRLKTPTDCHPSEKRVTYEAERVTNDAQKGDIAVSPAKNRQEPSRTVSSARALFSDFWDGWPNKVGRFKAEAAWKKLKADERSEALDNSVAWFSAWRAKYPDASPIHASTYLNQKRWLDEGSGGPPPQASDLPDSALETEARWVREQSSLCQHINPSVGAELVRRGLVTIEQWRRVA